MKTTQNAEPQLNPRAPSISTVLEAKRFALRRNVWFRILTRVERGVLDLTAKYVDNIRSTTLANLVTAILNKLAQSMENKLDRLVREVGYPLAQKISKIAASWGNVSAHKWAEDKSFAKYLAIGMDLS
jgi:hypothetical protein